MVQRIARGVAVVGLVLAASFGVGAATTAGLLVQAAFPFALVLIAVLHVLGGRAEIVAWAALTVVLLAGTYLRTGHPIEYAVGVAYLALAALGGFRSPAFLALAWLIHPLWDAVPRDLPAPLQDLPLACALFDTPIGLYLLWGVWKRHWS